MATATWQGRGFEKNKEKEAHGRNAESPSEIPAKGWKDTLYRIKSQVSEDRLSLISAGMAYYALLAFVPAITSVVLIYAWVSEPQQISQNISSAAQFLPKELQDILQSQLTSLASKTSATLGLSAILTLLFSIWSSSKGCKAIIEAMNVINDEKESRGFIKLNFTALWLTFLGSILAVLAIAVVVGLPALFSQFNLGDLVETGVTVVSWLILLGIFSLYLSFIYRYAPNRDKPQWKWVSWGAVVASVLWAAASLLFSWYAGSFGNFNKTYGSLGAVIVLMMWLYISSFVILMGGEINAEMEHQTKKDTTQGQPRPMGQRHARMADTLGESHA